MDQGASQSSGSLQRELGLPGAVLLGLGSILGTGVFVSLGLGAGLVGPAVVVAIVLAAGLATCNALSSAQLAASHAVSGGTYEYGYRYLGPAWGFTAGWMFLLAKSASAATAALGFAGYLLDLLGLEADGRLAWLAVGTVAVMTGIVLGGIRRSNTANAWIVGLTLVALGAFVLGGLPTLMSQGSGMFRPFFTEPVTSDGPQAAVAAGDGWTATRGLLSATALMFVAYTGYGRIATLGEEVREPRQTIPRAIVTTLVVSAVLYVAVALVAVGGLGSVELAQAARQEAAPLERAARMFAIPGLPLLVAIGAITAMLGVLLNLILGLSRVLLAMGRRGDTPAATARLDEAGKTPYVAVIVVGGLIAGLASLGRLELAWSFSAFTVLIYYGITNLAALQLPAEQRLYPSAFAICGLVGCLFLAFWVTWTVWLLGLILIAAGLAWQRWFAARHTATPRS